MNRSSRKYEIGSTVNKLIVLEHLPKSTYKVQCVQCNNISIETCSFLTRASIGKNISCRKCTKTGKYSYRIGDKFNFLTIVEIKDPKSPRANKVVVCECLCKNRIQIKFLNLKKRKIPSCGECLLWQPKYKRRFGDIPITYYERVIYQAGKRNIEFCVPIRYLANLYLIQNGKCALTGWDISFCENLIDGNTASLDRIDSSLGYVIGNLQWLHSKVNLLKNRLNQNDFINLCKAIASHQSDCDFQDGLLF